MTVAAVTNASLFDGHRVRTPTNIMFVASPGDIISTDAEMADLTGLETVVEGRGCTLLPALIDSVIDTAAADRDLQTFSSYGIATVLDMSSTTAEVFAMRAAADQELGLPAYLASGTIATAGVDEQLQLYAPRETTIVRFPADAEPFVNSRVFGTNQSNYIKVLVDLPGLEEPILTALVRAAHSHGRLAIAHATQKSAYSRALRAEFDVITSVPCDGELDDEVVNNLATRDVACIPTLCMVEAMVSFSRGMNDHSTLDFNYALANVKKLYTAGVRICAGTEANQTSTVPVSIGDSLHRELGLLVRAGLSNLDALRAATVVPAKLFSLPGGGALQPGLRADMILVEGNPLQDITATKRIRKVWIRGVEVEAWNHT